MGPGPPWALETETEDRLFGAQKGRESNAKEVRVKVARWCDRGRERGRYRADVER